MTREGPRLICEWHAAEFDAAEDRCLAGPPGQIPA